MAHEDFAENWKAYQRKVREQGPRLTLGIALERFEQDGPSRQPGLAVDPGCGSCNDAVELLNRGWTVIGVDQELDVARQVRVQLAPALRERLHLRRSRFEEFEVPDADLVNASFSLPFCRPDAFTRLWDGVVHGLRAGGRFAGQFFGERDGWADRPDMSFHTRQDVERLLSPFEVEYFEEFEGDRQLALGAMKRWHLFHVVARRRPP